jgi:hypothetical protein
MILFRADGVMADRYAESGLAANGCFRFRTFGQRMLPRGVRSTSLAAGNKPVAAKFLGNGWFKTRPTDASSHT